MPPLFSRNTIIIVSILTLLGIGLFIFISLGKKQPEELPKDLPELGIPELNRKPIGSSVGGRNIEAYTYGNGGSHLVFVGGIHGGYEWNSVILAYQFVDYFNENIEAIPEDLTITIIPSANPDGVYDVVGKEGRFQISDISANKEIAGLGRFNARGVDLNRNFDCKWKPKSMWRGEVVNAGLSPFSEPEAVAIRDFILGNSPEAVIFWHSQANAVYASECESGILPKTLSLMKTYSLASGYPAVESFDAYEITGDAEGWLASINIPAITVELQTHETIEWERNLAGVKALLALYSNLD